MAEMKFKFSIQQYQTEAVDAIVKVFSGQPFQDKVNYIRDIGTNSDIREVFDNDSDKSDDEYLLGFANAPIRLNKKELLDNIHKVQKEQNIKTSSELTKHLGTCSLDVEMETGTGKTYVYIKTMFELNRQYGWSKFIVVVPSIAIREGVQKSFEMMQDHFMEQYGKKARFFVYNSKNLTNIDTFSSSSDLSVMIINIQAFNARGNDARRIRMELDEFGSRQPIEVIKANHPIIILDEPQKMGGIKTQESLQEFNPLFTLNYSATHKEQHNLVYVLDALDAYRHKLVKKIEVKGFDIHNLHGTHGYLFLDNIIISPNKPPVARIELEIKNNNFINRKTRNINIGDDLYFLSNEMEQYREYVINEIDPLNNTVSFINGIKIHIGEVIGDVSERDIRRVQIRETIRSHFEKERELYRRGIKVLSLFFIDKVEHYRKYDENGNEADSEYGEMFTEEYKSLLEEYKAKIQNSDKTPENNAYLQYLSKIDVESTHTGYFSIDKKTGHKINSKTGRNSDCSDDESAYELILKDKEKLLSFDNPVRFIFSHSALREGWDNPNVFQICTLKHGGDSTTNKRQEVGRGLRLCVNQSGDRMDEHLIGSEVHEINKLTVIASEGYKNFVEALQQEIKENLYTRPTQATPDYFKGKQIEIDHKIITISENQANAIYRYLIKNDYIDDNNKISDTYHNALETNNLAPLPDTIKDLGNGVYSLINNICNENELKNMIENGLSTKVSENALNNNFYKKEFQTLWNYINHKWSYTVHFDSDELIRKASENINKNLYVTELRYTVTEGTQDDNWNSDDLDAKTGFSGTKMHSYMINSNSETSITYDLIGKIRESTNLTRKTVTAILQKINSAKFEMFKKNPEEFIYKVANMINEEKATMIVDDITYNQTDGSYDSTIFTSEKNKDLSKAIQVKKNIQDYLFTDGMSENSIERRFANDLECATEVIVYAKLPRGFQIPTPVGNYAPDWAIAFKEGTVKHIYFVAETKGSMETMQLRKIENAKISCARKLFNEISTDDVIYKQVNSYQMLLNEITSL